MFFFLPTYKWYAISKLCGFDGGGGMNRTAAKNRVPLGIKSRSYKNCICLVRLRTQKRLILYTFYTLHTNKVHWAISLNFFFLNNAADLLILSYRGLYTKLLLKGHGCSGKKCALLYTNYLIKKKLLTFRGEEPLRNTNL